MPQFNVGERVRVRPESRAVATHGGTRHHLACASGRITDGGRPDMGLYRVHFDLGEWGSFTATVDHRELETA